MMLAGKTIGWGLCGSHHTLPQILPVMRQFRAEGADIIPVVSQTILTTPTRYGQPAEWMAALREATGRLPLTSIPEVEPFGPNRTCDAVVVAPLTGNSLARLANAISDSAPLMAAKAQLRNGRPVVVAITTNDALGLNARNLATLLVTRGLFLVPFGQDSPQQKPTSLVAHLDLLLDTVLSALEGRQLQPILQAW
jgi:dipicolinate synthase subunit B